MKEYKIEKLRSNFRTEYLEMSNLRLDIGTFGVDPIFRYDFIRNSKKINWRYWKKHFKIIKDLL